MTVARDRRERETEERETRKRERTDRETGERDRQMGSSQVCGGAGLVS